MTMIPAPANDAASAMTHAHVNRKGAFIALFPFLRSDFQ
jgi:hypothetical protein